jgi:hypothetical protein
VALVLKGVDIFGILLPVTSFSVHYNHINNNKMHVFFIKQSAATIAVSNASTVDTSDKRTIRKYGSKLDASDSPSRSRSATKELICK